MLPIKSTMLQHVQQGAAGLHFGSHDNFVSSATNAGHLPLDDRYWNAGAVAARVEQELCRTIGFAHLWLAQDGEHLVLRESYLLRRCRRPLLWLRRFRQRSPRAAKARTKASHGTAPRKHGPYKLYEPRISPLVLDRFYAYPPSTTAAIGPMPHRCLFRSAL